MRNGTEVSFFVVYYIVSLQSYPVASCCGIRKERSSPMSGLCLSDVTEFHFFVVNIVYLQAIWLRDVAKGKDVEKKLSYERLVRVLSDVTEVHFFVVYDIVSFTSSLLFNAALNKDDIKNSILNQPKLPTCWMDKRRSLHAQGFEGRWTWKLKLLISFKPLTYFFRQRGVLIT